MINRVEVIGGKSKIREPESSPFVGHEDVFGLQVAMIDPLGMTVNDGIQNLQEGTLGRVVVPNVGATLGDVTEEIPFRTKLEDHEGAIRCVDDTVEREHVGMLAGLVVQSYLAPLDATLARIQFSLGQDLDGIWDVGQDIKSLVDNTESTDSENGDEFESPVQHQPQSILRRK